MGNESRAEERVREGITLERSCEGHQVCGVVCWSVARCIVWCGVLCEVWRGVVLEWCGVVCGEGSRYDADREQ